MTPELLLQIVGGLVVGAVMGLMGAGGAIFTVPIFVTVLHHDPKQAMLESLAVTGLIAAVASMRGALAGRVDWRRAGFFALAGIAGAQVAAPWAVRMPAGLQVTLFACLAVLAGWRLWSAAEPTAETPGQPRGAARRSMAAGFAIGALTSILGVGGGFLLIPALVVLEGLPMPRAVATSLVLIAANAAAGLAGHAWSGAFERSGFQTQAVLVVAVCGAIGSLAASRLGSLLPQTLLRRAFAVLLLAVTGLMALAHLTRA